MGYSLLLVLVCIYTLTEFKSLACFSESLNVFYKYILKQLVCGYGTVVHYIQRHPLTVYVCRCVVTLAQTDVTVKLHVHTISPRDRDWIGDICCLGDKLSDGMAAHSGHISPLLSE